MSLCPKCGGAHCAHTPRQRGQTYREYSRPLCDEERDALQRGNPEEKLKVAQKHAHDPVQKSSH